MIHDFHHAALNGGLITTKAFQIDDRSNYDNEGDITFSIYFLPELAVLTTNSVVLEQTYLRS